MRITKLIAAGLVLLFCPVGIFAQARNLEPGNPIERELKGGETDSYAIKVKKGQFLRVVAEQEGIDVAVVLSDPSGKVLVEADSPNGAWGPEPASLIAAASGGFQIQVKSQDKNAPAGKYNIAVADLREPRPEDQTRIAAETLLFAAGVLGASQDADSLRKANELLERDSALWHALKDPYEEALCLEALAAIRKIVPETQNFREALTYYNRALALYHEAGRRRNEATILGGIGIIHYGLGEKKEALGYYEQELPLERAAGNREGEATALNNLASVYADFGEKQKALEYDNQALALQRAMGDRDGEAKSLTNIGAVYDALGEKQKALENYSQALQLVRAVGDRAGEGAILGNMGQTSSELGEKQKALDYFSQALPLLRGVGGDHAGEAVTLNNIGSVYDALGEKQKALDYYNQALSLQHSMGDRSGEAATLDNLGATYGDLGEEQKALDYYNQALSLAHAVGDRRIEALALNNIGQIYWSQGEGQKALEYDNRALPVERILGDRGGEAGTLVNIGVVYFGQGDFQKAMEYLNQALPLTRAIGDRRTEAATLRNIGGTYIDLGEMQKALEYLSEALPLERLLGDRNGEVFTLGNMSSAYYLLHELQKSLDCLNQALPLARAVGDRYGEGKILNNTGLLYFDLGEKQKALEYLNQALPLQRAVGDRDGEAQTLGGIAKVQASLGEKREALKNYYQALVIFRAVRDVALEGTALSLLMEYWKAEKNPGLAIFFGKQSVNAIQQVRRNIQGLDKGVQKSFLESKADTYRSLADLLIGQGRLSEAQQVLDLLKEQEYLEFVRGGENTVDASRKPVSLNPEEQSSHETYEKIAGQITAIAQEYSDLHAKRMRTPEEETRLGELKEKLTVSNQEIERFFTALYVEFGKSARANQPTKDVREETSAMQQSVRELGRGTVALYTLVGETRYRVIVITANTMQAREYPIADTELRKKVGAFLEALKNPASDPLPASQELYKILFAPIADDLEGAKAQTVMWVLNDVLRYVPVAALYDGKQYLVEKYRNVVITTSSFTRLKDKVDLGNSAIAGMGVSKNYDGLGPLPAVPGELKSILRDESSRSNSGPSSGTILLDDEFTETHMATALDQHYPVVHIASHFVLQAGNETNSYLLLGGKDVGGKGYHLTLAELRTDPAMTFDGTELLTLSACQTGTGGTALNGREVDGLAFTAQQKGAKAVLASLWSVADESTALLMADFYKQWLGTPGTTKAAALQRAQLDMLHGAANTTAEGSGRLVSAENGAGKKSMPSYTHPFYWAPFILIGNWK